MGATDGAEGGTAGTRAADASPGLDASDGSIDGAASGGGASIATKCDPSSAFGPVTRLDSLNDQMYSTGTVFVDGDVAYFGAQRSENSDWEMFSAAGDPKADSFQTAHLLANVNTPDDEGGPILSSDGLTLFFNSSPKGQKSSSVYYAKRRSRADDFTEPQPLASVGSLGSVGVDSISPEGTTIYLESSRSPGNQDLYQAKSGASGVFGAPTPIDELNTDHDEFGIVISSDGLTVYFATTRENYGGGNIWVAHRAHVDAPFADLRPVTELNSIYVDAPTWLSPDGCTLYVIRGHNNAYWMNVARRTPPTAP